MDTKSINLADVPDREMFPGFVGKMVHTDDMTLAYWSIKKGSVLPEHQHVHKQIVQMVEGELEMTIGGVTRVCRTGDVIEIASNVPHSGTALTDAKVNDIFLPTREDYR